MLVTATALRLMLPDRVEIGFCVGGECSDDSILFAAGLKNVEDALVGARVLLGHGLVVEEHAGALRDVCAVHLEAALDVVVALDEVLDEHSGASELDQLRHRTARNREGGGTAERGFEYGQTEGLAKPGWVEVAPGVREQLDLLVQGELAEEFDVGVLEERPDVFLEVALALKIDLPGEPDRESQVDRELDREVRALLVIETPEEADIVAGASTMGNGPGSSPL
jgi:hypothetical protein